MTEIDGIINFYKESGQTSQQAVAAVRRVISAETGAKVKAGHAGTLDPLAEGVLPILVGKATKFYDKICGGMKLYRAECTFGAATDTQDRAGKVIFTCEPAFCEEELKVALAGFVGGYEQETPMFSARRVNGQRLYELARRGENIERKSVFAQIYGIKIEKIALPHTAEFLILCGKGVYIRAICDDLGKKLGCGAFMSGLVREMCGGFFAENAVKLKDFDIKRDLIANGRRNVFF